jgi:outer membrane biosynthesis protein TonB
MKPRRIKISEMKLLLLFVVACVGVSFSAATNANQSAESTKCPVLGTKEFSAKQMRSRLRHTQSIDPPCCAGTLNLKGTVVLDVSVNADGDVTCVDQISGHPLILTSALHSVSGWKFQPYSSGGEGKPFHGKLVIKFHATERSVSFKVIDEALPLRSTSTMR